MSTSLETTDIGWLRKKSGQRRVHLATRVILRESPSSFNWVH
ncbi:hypothetical protein RESH_00627 [Rhodopirellula europaea SH398]|uniref:Uncharacterized protein n=2 Tax=Rhodopirellula europaea TaxID=1263866 RepID=M5SBD9_9BACT|nr:hypothetical protein RE6C_05987 [Rhodopirellula europaea 6C]EMI28785.1 hypothetical protein RESH_00627 [Rhodopirellula europaea SH398]